MKEYTPTPVDTSKTELLVELQDLVEVLAKNTHNTWAAGRVADGWKWGPARDDKKKLHPCLVEYDDLPEAEKEYDRNTAIEILKLLVVLGWNISPASVVEK